MEEREIKNGDIVMIDYITHFAKERMSLGRAVVLWKCSLSHQPLIIYINDIKNGEYTPCWSSYECISKVVGHMSLTDRLHPDSISFYFKGESCSKNGFKHGMTSSRGEE